MEYLVEVFLGFAAFGFLCQALEVTWHIGRLTIQPGWMGLVIWGAIAALQASKDAEGVFLSPSFTLIALGAILVIAGIVTIIVTQRTKNALEEIHTLVNSQSDKQIDRIDQLTSALEKAGVAVPLTK